MTLLFAGHDTTTSTVSFMFYELAHHPEIAARLVAEQQERLRGERPTAEQLMGEGAAAAGDGAGGDAADVPARVDRPAALGGAV